MIMKLLNVAGINTSSNVECVHTVLIHGKIHFQLKWSKNSPIGYEMP